MDSEAAGYIRLIFSLAACADRGGGTYSGSQSRVAHTVEHGQILAIAPAIIEDQPSGLGLLGGALVGGVLGSLVGGGRGRVVGAVAGGVVGGAAGYGLEREMNRSNAQEISVKLDSGKEIAIVQGLDDQFYVGDRVRVFWAPDGSARVRY